MANWLHFTYVFYGKSIQFCLPTLFTLKSLEMEDKYAIQRKSINCRKCKKYLENLVKLSHTGTYTGGGCILIGQNLFGLGGGAWVGCV